MIRLIKPYVLFPIIYIIAVLASFAAMKDIPTVGASGMIYAVFGMQTVIVIFNKATAKQKRLFFFGIALMLTVSFFNGGSSFIVHAASFTYGSLFWMIKDQERYFHKHLSRNINTIINYKFRKKFPDLLVLAILFSRYALPSINELSALILKKTASCGAFISNHRYIIYASKNSRVLMLTCLL